MARKRQDNPRGGLLDLPLGPAAGGAEGPPSLPLGHGGEPDLGPRQPRLGRRRRRRGRAWLWILLALAVGIAVAILVLRPRQPRARFSTELADLGGVRVSGRSEPLGVEATNVGDLPMLVERLALTGPAAVEFEVVSEDCVGREIGTGETCRVELALAPAAMGAREATLELHGQLRRSPASLGVVGEGIAPVLAVDAADLAFQAADVGARGETLSLRVANRGTAPLEIAGLDLGGPAAGDFSRRQDGCGGQTLEPGAECGVELAFAPRAAGERRAEVTFESDAFGDVPVVSLTGTGIWSGPTLTLETERVDFGDRLVSGEPAAEKIRLTNRQSEAVSGLSVSAEGGFAVSGGDCGGKPVQPGSSCTVTVSFRPREERVYEGELSIRHSVAEPIVVPLRGRGVAPRLVVAAGRLDFGRVRVSEPSAQLEVRMENRGSAPARLERVEVGGSEAAAFRKSRDGCAGGELAPGGDCAVELRFSPRREGTHEAELVIRPAPAEGPARIPLSGFGIASRLQIDRESVEFGEVRRTTSRDVGLTLSNRGTDRLGLEAIGVSGMGTDAFSVVGGSCTAPAALEPGGECTLTIRFAPTADGRVTARLDLSHDAFSGPRGVPLGGVGLAPPVPRISVSPSFLDFGSQPVGQRSSIESVRVANPGTGRLELRDIRIAGDHANDFRTVPATCDAVPALVPGGDCSLGVRFVPGGPGDRRATLVIRHNAAGGDVVLELRGRGM